MPFNPPAAVQMCLSFDPPPSHLDTPRQVLLLRLQGMSLRAIARQIGCGRNTVTRYVRQACRQLESMAG